MKPLYEALQELHDAVHEFRLAMLEVFRPLLDWLVKRLGPKS